MSGAGTWPDFLIVGTARAGTTSLHEMLGKHHDIYMPLQKEPCFFTFYHEHPEFKDSKNRYISDVETYQQIFAGQENKLKGESSTPYLYFHQKTIANIKQLVPDYKELKIIIVLRDPAERAYSQYMHNRRDLLEPLEFAEALKAEPERKKENRHFDFFYADKGFYFEQVKDYKENFRNVKILFYESLEKNPEKFLEDVFQFLGVNGNSGAELVRRNQSGEMKVKWLKRIITTRKNPVLNMFRKAMGRSTKKKLRNWIKDKLLRYNLKKTEMDPVIRKQLIDLYWEDILKLQQLVDKDLSDWLRV